MNNIIKNLTLVCLLTFIGAGSVFADFPSARVVNGVDASQGDYPFAAYIEFTCDGSYAGFCGGSYIGGQMILTAGHCIEPLFSCSTWSADVALNRTNLNSSNGGVYTAKLAYLHPDYQSLNNDIAALELTTTPSGVTPLAMVGSGQSSFYNNGTTVTIMGWGDMTQREDNNSGGASTLPNIMQEANVPVRSNATCSSDYGSQFDANAMFCAGIYDNGSGNVGVDTCQGDSGGPVVVNDSGTLRQIGIVSWGEGCASSQYYGVYTRVINYLDYVNSLLAADTDDVAPSVTINSGRCNGTTCKATITCNDPAPSVGLQSVTARLKSRDGGGSYAMKVTTNDGITFKARKKSVASGRYKLKVKCSDYKLQSASASKNVKAVE